MYVFPFLVALYLFLSWLCLIAMSWLVKRQCAYDMFFLLDDMYLLNKKSLLCCQTTAELNKLKVYTIICHGVSAVKWSCAGFHRAGSFV